MVSKRLKSDARAHMKAHPGISYQEALRAVTGDGAEPGMEYSTNDLIDLLAVFGITESDAEDLPRVWERNSGTATLRAPYAHDVDGDGHHVENKLEIKLNKPEESAVNEVTVKYDALKTIWGGMVSLVLTSVLI